MTGRSTSFATFFLISFTIPSVVLIPRLGSLHKFLGREGRGREEKGEGEERRGVGRVGRKGEEQVGKFVRV